VATGNLLLQGILLVLGSRAALSWPLHVLLFALAYFTADFINGFAHLWMDNHDRYRGVMGPIVANFHLHHARIKYERRPLWAVYYLESRSKIWLLLLQLLALGLVTVLPGNAIRFVAYFAILSSLAEVSHYACHTLSGPWVDLLGRLRLILPRAHHRVHHASDNVNYAFLNGMSDPILNAIARRFFAGYKNRSDLHAADHCAPPVPGT
jgi:sterol desaturase/sphingolipid hydroxylase (fatty acid hydroxylase superfamily)